MMCAGSSTSLACGFVIVVNLQKYPSERNILYLCKMVHFWSVNVQFLRNTPHKESTNESLIISELHKLSANLRVLQHSSKSLESFVIVEANKVRSKSQNLTSST